MIKVISTVFIFVFAISFAWGSSLLKEEKIINDTIQGDYILVEHYSDGSRWESLYKDDERINSYSYKTNNSIGILEWENSEPGKDRIDMLSKIFTLFFIILLLFAVYKKKFVVVLGTLFILSFILFLLQINIFKLEYSFFTSEMTSILFRNITFLSCLISIYLFYVKKMYNLRMLNFAVLILSLGSLGYLLVVWMFYNFSGSGAIY